MLPELVLAFSAGMLVGSVYATLVTRHRMRNK